MWRLTLSAQQLGPFMSHNGEPATHVHMPSDSQPAPVQAPAQGQALKLGQALRSFKQSACAGSYMPNCTSDPSVAVQSKVTQGQSFQIGVTGIGTHPVWALKLYWWLHSPALALALECPLAERPLIQQPLLPPLQARQQQVVPRVLTVLAMAESTEHTESHVRRLDAAAGLSWGLGQHGHSRVHARAERRHAG